MRSLKAIATASPVACVFDDRVLGAGTGRDAGQCAGERTATRSVSRRSAPCRSAASLGRGAILAGL